MGEYKLLCVVLFTLIIGSKTWPHKAREDTDNEQSKGTMRKAATTGSVGVADDDDGITFPDDDTTHGRKDFSAEGKGVNCTGDICEKVKDYPYDHIRKIVGRLPDLPNIFGELVGNLVDSGSRSKPEDPDLSYLCETNIHISYPKTMKNHLNITKFIVNDDDTYKQGVVYENCVTTDRCSSEASFPIGADSKCVQKYTTVRLLAIEPDKLGNATYDTFNIPSCCVCAIMKPKV